MKQVIYKFPLVTDRTSIMLPAYASVLTVQLQNGWPTLWIALDPKAPKNVKRTFVVLGTGWEFDDEAMYYIGTYQIGEYVWHVMELAD